MNKEVKQKLNKILYEEITIDNKLLSTKDIYNFENKYNIKLPTEYKNFLINYIERYINENYYFPMIEKSMFVQNDGFESVDYLYGGSFIENAERYIDEYGYEFLPIGEAVGNIICIGIQKNNFGMIYYLYHEDSLQHHYLVSRSFNEFILSFIKRETAYNINLDEIEIELDENLM